MICDMSKPVANNNEENPMNSDIFRHAENDARRKVARLEARWNDLQKDLERAPHDSDDAKQIEDAMDRVECDIYEAQARLADLV